MQRVLQVAGREFAATVTTKGFLFGILLTPLLIVGVISIMPFIMNRSAPKVVGEIAVIDQTGQLGDRLSKAFSAEEVARRSAERSERIKKAFGSKTESLAMDPRAKDLAEQAAGVAFARQELSVRLLPSESDPETEKAPIADADGKGNTDPSRRVALVVVPKEAADAAQPAKYRAFFASRLDFDVKNDIKRQVGDAIIDARIAGSGLDAARVRKLLERPEVDDKDVTKAGVREASGELAGTFIPMGFMMLVWISVFTSGQYLLTSLIEEKSNRVMELLLSAVSPKELMTGKIMGQMGVGLTILLFYAGLGGGALIAFQRAYLLDPMNLVYLGVYFLIAFTLIASMMAAIGSAVADVREAQSLMGPVMIVLMIPMMLWMPIQRNPNSMFAQILSFIPPINPFVMVLRLTGAEKVPTWQIPVSMISGFAACWLFVWAAAKIFRVGVLMYGKPPSLLGLIKWIRYA